MIAMSRILCPVDFSEASRHALDHAAALAGWYGARVTALYVFANRPAMDLPPLRFEDKDRDRIGTEMARFTGHLPADSLDFQLREASDVAGAILDEAAVESADLLVIGSHGRSGLAKLLLGSVTEKVIHRAPCPMLIVPPRAPDTDPRQPITFDRIVCAIDFSRASERALRYALALAQENDAELTVLYAIEVPPEISEIALSPLVSVDSIRAAAEADCLRRLRDLIPVDARTYCSVRTSVREGAAYREILKEAAEQNAGLIVMGAQGRRAVDRLVFGSNTARVARAATCPVLIVGHESGGTSWAPAQSKQ